MKRAATIVLFSILCFGTAALTGQQSAGPLSPAGKGKLGFGFEPGLVPGQDFVSGQLIVGIRDGLSIQAVRGAAAAHRGRVVKEITSQAALLEFGSEGDVLAAVDQLLALPGVSFIERNGFMRIPRQPQLPAGLKGRPGEPKAQKGASSGGVKAASVSADLATGLQHHLTIIRKTAALPALVAAPPMVAVLDTGVDYTHSDLLGKVLLGLNAVANNGDPMDDNGHGTHCAGLIGAVAGNNRFGEGVCPNCKILAVKVLGGDGSGTFFDVALGMSYTVAVRNLTVPPTRVVSMSLGGPASALVAAQALAMRVAGMTLVAAAGNENSSTVPSFPGADANVALRVTATTENDSRAYFSNFSPIANPSLYNIAAPGWDIYSTVPGEGFAQLSGTSMATPITAGAAALVWGQFPALTRDQLVVRILAFTKIICKGFAACTRRLDVRKAIIGVAETALVGQLVDPFTGDAHSPNTSADTAVLNNLAVAVAADLTNRSGMYEMTTLTAGTRTIRASRPAGPGAPVFPLTSLRSVAIAAGTVAGPLTDAKPRARAVGNVSITLDWWTTQPVIDTTGCIDACNGWDIDLDVKLPSLAYITPGVGDLSTAPFVKSPRDSFNDLVPAETVVIGSSAANGIYRVFADKFPSATQFNPSWTGSLASVQVFNGATLIANFSSVPACGATRFWYVGNLTKAGAAYAWATVNACVAVAP